MGWYRSQAYYDSGTWRATWTGEGGGVLINQAPHLLDLFTWLAGLPVKVTAQVRTRLHNIEVEDEAYALLEYDNGAHGYLYASTIEAPSHHLIEICGDVGKLIIHGNEMKLFEVEPGIREHSAHSTEMWGGPRTSEVPLQLPEGRDSHADITRNFARAILRDEPLIAPGDQGLNAVEMINSFILSGKRGRPVEIPVDRLAYAELLAELQSSSQAKERVRAQTATDPAHSLT
jgi:predicted dehydrogenase